MAIIQNKHPEDSFGYPQVSVVPLEYSQKTFVSHDFTNKTSWWYASEPVTDEVLDTADNLTYTADNDNWIDKSKITDDHILPETVKTPVIKVDDEVVTTGFTINHAAGTVTFDASQEGSTVKASYSYSPDTAGSSIWEIIPDEGKILRIRLVEVQMTKEVAFSGRTYFDILVNTTQYGWVVAQSNQYKGIPDLIARSNRGYTMPACGGFSNDVIVLPWDYPAVIDLWYDKGTGFETPSMKLQMRTENDVVHTGEWGVVAAYCLSRNLP